MVVITVMQKSTFSKHVVQSMPACAPNAPIVLVSGKAMARAVRDNMSVVSFMVVMMLVLPRE